jgi:hypothetical protein
MAYVDGFAVAVPTDIVAAVTTLPAQLDELLRAGAALTLALLPEAAVGAVLLAAGVAGAQILRMRTRPGSREHKSDVAGTALEV